MAISELSPCLMVIFGGTGDLARRKLLPALFFLYRQRMLPSHFFIIATGSQERTQELFLSEVQKALMASLPTMSSSEGIAGFLSLLEYVKTDLSHPSTFPILEERMKDINQRHGLNSTCIFYLATPQTTFESIIIRLPKLDSGGKGSYRRIVIEKPFGSDLLSAVGLNAVLAQSFPERDVFRIDHYLGKETVQNILAFRFANAIFEPVWNSQYVDSIQITVAESLGMGGRGLFYESTGALRDIIQNHAMQLLALVAMEPPLNFDSVSVRDEKVKVLRAIQPLSEAAHHTVRGQYVQGVVDGRAAVGYRSESHVDHSSVVETYAALRLEIDNWRWSRVPIYIRTGKRLAKRVSEISVEFKRPPHLTFRNADTRDLSPNAITLRIQPEESIRLRFGVKVPSPGIRIRSTEMDFHYRDFASEVPDAYERLLLDCMLGDTTLFTRADEVEAAWALIDPIESAWKESSPPLANYPAGTWGPSEADDLLAIEGRSWHQP